MVDRISAPDRSARLRHYVGEKAGKLVSLRAEETQACGLATTYQDADQFIDGLNCFPGTRNLAARSNVKTLFQNYVTPVQDAFRRLGLNTAFRVGVGDNLRGFGKPTFVKSCAFKNDASDRYILPLNRRRHFEHVPRVSVVDIPFDKKHDTVVWRGTTTGLFDKPGRVCIYHRFDRFEREGFDIGYSKIVQMHSITPRSGLTEADLKPCMKPKLRIRDMLAYKYLLCMQGNDVASGLKWMLLSQSVVLMPHPTVGSWYCERFLQPYVHYVPISADLSDLVEQVQWCRDNPEVCQQISANATQFMQPFLDEEQEDGLFLDVVSTYAESVDFVFEAADRMRFFPSL